MNLNKYSKKIFDFFAETSNYNKVLNLARDMNLRGNTFSC